MLTKEENELLCRVEGDAPMGQLMRRHWQPVCLVEEVERGRRQARPRADVRRRPGRVPRQRRARRRAWASTARIAARRCSSAATRNAGCAACTTAGRWTSRATSSRWRPSRRRARWREKVKHKAYPAQESGGFVWDVHGAAGRDAGVRAAGVGADATRRNVAIVEGARAVQLGADPGRRDRLGAQLEPAFLRHAAGAGRARDGDRQASGCASTDKAPRLQLQRTGYGFRYAALRRPITNAATKDYVRITVFVAPVTALIPPNNKYNVANINVPRDDTQHGVLFHRAGATADTRHRHGDVAQVPAASASASTSTRTIGAPHAREQLLQDRQAMKARRLHRHHRHPEPGHGDVGDHGPDRRPHARAPRRERPRGRRVPPPDGRGGARFARGEPAIGTTAPRNPARQAALVPGHRAEDGDWRTLGASEEELTLYPKEVDPHEDIGVALKSAPAQLS